MGGSSPRRRREATSGPYRASGQAASALLPAANDWKARSNMASAPRPLIAGNWKMNGWQRSGAELNRIIEGSRDLVAHTDLLVCPPATLIASFVALARGSLVTIGHSERRTYHKETDAEVQAKVRAAWRAQLTAIVCIGETKEQRAGGQTLEVVGGQLQNSLPPDATAANTVIAYEPVWAIGTGWTPTPADVAEIHGVIRKRLTDRFGQVGEGIRILYGGSVKQ